MPTSPTTHNTAADAYDFGYSVGRIDVKGEILRAIATTDKPSLSVEELTTLVNPIPNE